MPDSFDEKFDKIFKDIEDQKESPRQPLKNVYRGITTDEKIEKKDVLAETELKAYLDISSHYKLTVMAISNLNHALKVWINGILIILLEKHGLDKSEWERISHIGDNDRQIEKKLEDSWMDFFNNKVKTKQIDAEIWKILQANSELK